MAAEDNTPAPGAPIELASVSKWYQLGDRTTIAALDQVTLSIPAGIAVAITGPSGSGKSTLLHLIGAMDSADEGRILVDDTEVTALTGNEQSDYRRSVGFVFQRFHLLPAMTVLDNIAAPLLPYKTDFDPHERAAELLAAVGLEGRGDALPSQLSGGQQQRVAIARALINHPKLLLADEPTGNLDSHAGTEILELVLRLRDTHGMTILLATHDPVVAARCDRVIRIRDGRILDQVDITPSETPEELLQRISRYNP